MEEEFQKWLRRSEKSLTENFQFALKAWQSGEFTLSTKYDIVLSWLEKEILKINNPKDQPIEELKDLLKLRVQPGLVKTETKSAFIEAILNAFNDTTFGNDQDRNIPELLRSLMEYELLQDLYRFNHHMYARVFGTFLKQYELYIKSLNDKIQSTHESEFIYATINVYKESAKRTSTPTQFALAYEENVIKPMAELLLTMRAHQIDLFAESLIIEEIICQEYSDLVLIRRVFKFPLHVRLLAIEYAVVNRRNVEIFQQELIRHVFNNIYENNVKLAIIGAAYTLETLRKHNISLISSEKDNSPIAKIGNDIEMWVKKHIKKYLREILLLLCATLRYNPLILEKQIFQLTTRIIVASKNTDNDEQYLFEEYLQLLLDMFRRLSRAEKFVFHLLKSLKDWLEINPFPQESLNNNKRKTNEADVFTNEAKQIKLTNDIENTQNTENLTDSNDYLSIILKILLNSALEKGNMFINMPHVKNSFPYLKTTWPSETVGITFSKVITGLMSKPSLTIWKSLLYALKEHLQLLQATTKAIKEKQLFYLDVTVALLCQYFNGCKLIEQADKFLQEITDTRALTGEVLADFGHLILAREHENRLINAFMEFSYQYANFELLLIYYSPDGLTDDRINAKTNLKHMHSYLTSEEWALLEQRTWNFGKNRCKYLMNRLLMQRYQANQLLLKASSPSNINFVKTLTCHDSDVPVDLVLKDVSSSWLISTRKRSEKEELASIIFQKPDLFYIINDDLETVELVTLKIFENLCRSFSSCKNSQLKTLNCDFATFRQHNDPSASGNLIKPLFAQLQTHLEIYHLKAIPTEDVQFTLQMLAKLPIAHLRIPTKWLIFILLLALYRDLLAAADMSMSTQTFELLSDFLHFGQHLPIFKYLSTEVILQLLPLATCLPFYEYIFDTIKSEEKGSDEFLSSLAKLLKKSEQKLNNDDRKLLLIAIETLSNTTGVVLKRVRPHLEILLEIFGNYVMAHFNNYESNEQNSIKHKKFVEKTLAGFAAYANSVLTKTIITNDNSTAMVNDQFRHLTKIYVGHSVDYHNQHAIHLIKVVLNHREKLELDQAEVEFILSAYWRQLNSDLKAEKTLDEKNSEAVVKLIICNKTNEDFLLTLKDLETIVQAEEQQLNGLQNILSLIALIGKCQFTTIKGAIFNEQFKQITTNIAMNFIQDERQQFVNLEQVYGLLHCQQVIAENKMVPLSMDTLDSIMAFLIDINIKKFQITDTNMNEFKKLHLAMSELCVILLKQRKILLIDRLPQFMHVFKDLLQSVVWYKSDRQNDILLTEAELNELSELALKLATLMSLIAFHSLHFKRIAPFILTFVINLMVSNKRPTTLYTKIKTHVESICYDLIGICDHRSGRFILRCSNEAGRQLYELFLKDHKKYRKFKGKV